MKAQSFGVRVGIGRQGKLGKGRDPFYNLRFPHVKYDTCV